MAEELDDDEYFQQDFTTASEWEVFNARLEEIFHEWKLLYVKLGDDMTKNQLALCEWDVRTESIYFADVELVVTRYRAKLPTSLSTSVEKLSKHDKVGKNQTCQSFVDLMAFENDFCIVDEKSEKTIHPLARWYGLRDFVVVSPARYSISIESQVRVLLSSIHIAVAESNCEVPVFVHVLDKIQHVYLGVCEFLSTRLNFDIIHLATVPSDCQYISRILKMFKEKIGVRYVDPVVITFRETYRLARFYSTQYLSPRQNAFIELNDDSDEPSVAIPSKEKIANETFCVFPFGVGIDPVMEIVLYCTGPKIEETLIVDNFPIDGNDQSFEFKKLSIRLKFEDVPICFMSRCLSLFLNLTELKLTLPELIDDMVFYSGNVVIEKNPLDQLTEPKIASSVRHLWIKNETKKDQKLEGPIDDTVIMNMLYYLFPDAQKDSPYNYSANFSKDANGTFDPMQIKTAYPDSLVHRLGCILSICYSHYGGIKAVAQFWAEFCQEMRYRVINCIAIPGVAKGFPDLRTCLLHQKFQMLNICMERRRLREKGAIYTQPEEEERGTDEVEEDDEFYDCSDGEEQQLRKWNEIKKPDGRLLRFENKMLVDSDEPLFIPFTQDPVPKTEDQLEDDAKVMLELGPGSELHAQMMSASLLSDMESFKAANPTAKIEDFIRWYSPNDWIEDPPEGDETEEILSAGDNKTKLRKGHLSFRMEIPGNIWQTVWNQAKPVSARRQKRLFDDAKEAEKVLHFFESRNIGQITQLTLASLFHSAITIVKQEFQTEDFDSSDVKEIIDKLMATCCKLSRENWFNESKHTKGNSLYKWEILLDDIKAAEYMAEQVRSIKTKLFPNSNILNDEEIRTITALLKGYEIDLKEVKENTIGFNVLQMFAESKIIQSEQGLDTSGSSNIEYCLPKPIEKQYTFRVNGKTVNKGLGGPQFLRAILAQNEFRLCGAFSKDTTFY